MTQNLKAHIDEIYSSFCNKMYAQYLNGLWRIQVGYRTDPLHQVRVEREIAQWQEDFDCAGALCTESQTNGVIVTTYPQFGNSPFPSIGNADKCFMPGWGVSPNAVPQNIIIEQDTLTITQYTVDTVNGPVSTTNTFTVTSLIGKTISIALGTVLDYGVDFSFNVMTGTITLLLGRVFNPGEVYTISSY